MASCQTSRWAGAAPYVKLTVTQSSSTNTTAILSWTLQYIASDPAYTSVAKSYTVKIAGSTVKTGTYDINKKTGTYTIASGSKTITKTTSSQSISFSVSFAFNLTWSGVPGGTQSASGSISVAAKTKYTVSYNANGGTGAPSSQTKWHGTALTLSSTKPTRTGYSFQGWATSASGSVAYAAGASYTANAAVTLYAVWKAYTYTVSYNANGGTGAPSSQTKTYGVTLTLSSTKPTRTGYSFQGWATSASGSVAYSSGGSYTSNANATLYAVWKALTYTVKYNANGGTGAPSSQTKTYGVTLTLSSTNPKRDNYIFLGWGNSASATSVLYTAGASYTANAGITLYAVWKRAYEKPRIDNLSVTRCDGNSVAAEDGKNVLVTFDWSSDKELTDVCITCLLGTTAIEDATFVPAAVVGPDTWSGTFSGKMGHDTLELDSTYTIRVTLVDAGGSTTKTATLGGVTKFAIDCLAGGKGIAFGKPAGLVDYADFGYMLHIDNNKAIFGSDPNGVIKEALNPQNLNGNTVLGWGNYNQQDGNTNIYGYDVNIGVSNIANPDYYRPYRRRGDTITFTLRTAGYVTNSGTDVTFLVPFAVPIIGAPTAVAASKDGFVLRQGNSYTHGSSATTFVTPDSYTAVVSMFCGVYITAKFSNITNVTNNDSIGIYWSGTITLS